MNKLIKFIPLIFALAFCNGWLHGQVTQPPGVILVGTAPSGACTAGVQGQMVTSTGAIWTCQSGTWATVGGGGGSQTWPTTPGITVCTGTPCTAWGTSLTAPSGAIVGTTDTQTLTNKTVDGVTPTTFGFLDPTSSVQTQLNAKAPLASPALTGTPTAPTQSCGSNTDIATGAYVANCAGGATLPTYWQSAGFSNGNTSTITQNRVWCSGDVMQGGGAVVGHISLNAQTVDGDNSIGIYPQPATGTTATLAASATFTGFVGNLALTQGAGTTISAPKGAILVCITSDAVSPTTVVAVESTAPTWFSFQDVGASSSGGNLPSTITWPSPSPQAVSGNSTGPVAIVLYP